MHEMHVLLHISYRIARINANKRGCINLGKAITLAMKNRKFLIEKCDIVPAILLNIACKSVKNHV